MSLRITQSMLYGRALRDVRDSLRFSTALQEQVATGRRVNRPSDDPAATLRILPLRAEIRDLEQLLENVQIARETLNLGSSALQEGSDLMQRTRELMILAANGTTSEQDLTGLGEQVDQLLGQMLGIANTNRAGRYLFGGTATDRAPFRLVTDERGTRVLYDGNDGTVQVEVAPGIETALNASGEGIFQRRSRSSTTFDGETGARPTGALDSGVGFDTLTASFAGLSGGPSEIVAGTGTTTALGNLNYTFSGGTLSVGGGPPLPVPATDQTFQTADGRSITLTVTGAPNPASGTLTAMADLSTDGGATTTRVDFTANEVQVVDSLDGAVLNVDVAQLTRTGDESVTYTGTFDPFTLLIGLRDTLRDADSTNRDEIQERVNLLLAEIDNAHDSILDGVTTYGSRSEHMDLLQNRVENLRIGARESLSSAEDTDLPEAIVKLQQQQLAYEASLSVTGRIVQTSLLNYLR